MIGGQRITDITRAQARELLESAAGEAAKAPAKTTSLPRKQRQRVPGSPRRN
jgi:hypothetical protein